MTLHVDLSFQPSLCILRGKIIPTDDTQLDQIRLTAELQEIRQLSD